ncbi:MAG: glycosyltransferase family 39 protein [Acidobacteriota bacterium]|nr:glycosyltransferase family 39 protein [Acidobacteriota bacterium]
MNALRQTSILDRPEVSEDSGHVFRDCLILALIVLVAVFDLFVIGLHSPLGTDDLMARISAQSTSLSSMLTLLRVQPVNVDAPVFPILAFLSARLPLPIDIAISLPAVCGMCVAMIATFLLVRGWLGVSAGYLAAVMLTLTPYTDYGVSPRPYALLLGSVALSVLCWAKATGSSRRRRLWLVGFSFSTTLALLTHYFAIFSHYFAIFSVLAVVLAEITRSLQKKKIDWPIWIALAISALIFLPVYAAFAPAGQPYRAHPFYPVRLSGLLATYRDLFKSRLILVAIAAASLLAAASGRPKKFQKPSISEWILVLTLSLVPVLVFATGELYTHTYVERYGICALLGVAILVAALVSFIAGGTARAILPGLAIIFVLHQIPFVRLAREPVYSPKSLWPAKEPDVLRNNAELPLMTPDFDYAMRAKFYAPTWLSSRLIMVGSAQSMLRFKGTDAPTLAMLAIHRWTGWPMQDYESFIREHKRFLMYGEYWGLDALKSDGAAIKQLQNVGPYHLYLVTLP